MPQSPKPNKPKQKKWKNKNKNKTKQKSKSKRNKHYKKRKHNNNKTNDEISKDTMKDPRFKKVFTDPRFQSIPQKQKDPNKVKVDSRFASMFTDPAFRTSYRIDRYGREITNNEAYDLHKFYQLEGYEAEHEQEDSPKKPKKLSKTMQKQADKFKAEQNNEIDEFDTFWEQWDDNKNTNTNSNTQLTVKEEKLLNRKAGKMFAYDADSTSSSSQSDYDYNKLTSEQVGDDSRAILDDQNQQIECSPTHRLAIVNCDWDNLSSKDIYMIFRSFLPSTGSIIKVSIYPSEYGMKMMQKEHEVGPDASIWQNNKLSTEMQQMEELANFIDANEEKKENEHIHSDSDSDMDDIKRRELQSEMSELTKLEDTITAIRQGRAGDVLEDEIDVVYNKSALRKYELQKLRYYYAIIELDSIETSDKLYQELNNREYRHTCNVLNISFVNDDFTAPFSPRDVCSTMPENYIAASDAQSNALGSTFLELSWDKTDPNRMELCQRSFNEFQLNKMDLESYLQDDDGITDAGFDTDYPVTEYDTDTPDKKVLIKRRARNRYVEILDEFKQLENGIVGSDDDDGVTTDGTSDGENGGFRINVSSDGDKVESFYIEDEMSKLNEWIDTQKRLKESINKSIDDGGLEVNLKRKRKRMEIESDSDEVPLVVDGDMDEGELNNAYFNSENMDGHGDLYGKEPVKKRQRLDGDDGDGEREKKRAILEMMMATNEGDIAGKYDPENNEIEEGKLSERLNKKLRRNWRLKWLIKKAVKKKLKQNDKFEFDENDQRFLAVVDDPDFAIDPTNVRFKNTKVMNTLLRNTRKRRRDKWNSNRWNKKGKNKVDMDESLLIESIKMKNDNINQLEDGQKVRKQITEKLKQKGLSSFH